MMLNPALAFQPPNLKSKKKRMRKYQTQHCPADSSMPLYQWSIPEPNPRVKSPMSQDHQIASNPTLRTVSERTSS